MVPPNYNPYDFLALMNLEPTNFFHPNRMEEYLDGEIQQGLKVADKDRGDCNYGKRSNVPGEQGRKDV